MTALREEWRIPGIFIRDLLATGRYGPASAHRLYLQAIKDFNSTRRLMQRTHRGMRYASMVRYFNLLEELGAIRRTGTAPVTSLLPHLRRANAPSEPAVQVLYEAVASHDSNVWVKPWSLVQGR